MLDRVVSLCRARRCAIVALRSRLVTQNLAAMPGVLAVATAGARPRIGAAA